MHEISKGARKALETMKRCTKSSNTNEVPYLKKKNKKKKCENKISSSEGVAHLKEI